MFNITVARNDNWSLWSRLAFGVFLNTWGYMPFSFSDVIKIHDDQLLPHATIISLKRPFESKWNSLSYHTRVIDVLNLRFRIKFTLITHIFHSSFSPSWIVQINCSDFHCLLPWFCSKFGTDFRNIAIRQGIGEWTQSTSGYKYRNFDVFEADVQLCSFYPSLSDLFIALVNVFLCLIFLFLLQ